MSRILPCSPVAAALLLLTACSGGGSRPGPVTPIGDTTIDALRLTVSPSGPPEFVLNWRATSTGQPPSAFRIFLAGEPLTDANRERFQIREVPGASRSVELAIQPGSDLRFVAVQAMRSDGVAGRVSRTMPVDTTDRISFQVLAGAGKQVWMTGVAGTPTLVATSGENLNWTPGSRGLGYVAPGSGKAMVITPAIWNGKLDANLTPAPSLPTRAIPADWYSMRFSATGSVAFRVDQGGSKSLFVRTPDGNETRVSDVDVVTGDVEQFAWSPSGAHLLYLQQGVKLNRHAFVVAADGNGRRRLHGDLDVDEYVLSADWSPSGGEVSFDVVDANTAATGILSVHVVSDQSERLGVASAHASVWNESRLWFTTRHSQPKPGMGIAVHAPPTGASGPAPHRQVLQWEGDLFGLRVSGDGKQLAFLHRDAAKRQTAHLLDLATDKTVALVLPAGEKPLRLEWSVVGRLLAVSVQRPGGMAVRVFDLTVSTQTSAVWITGNLIQHFAWSPFSAEIAALNLDPLARVFRTNGAALVEVSAVVPSGLPVLDFTWSNWGIPGTLGVFSTLVSK